MLKPDLTLNPHLIEHEKKYKHIRIEVLSMNQLITILDVVTRQSLFIPGGI